MILSGRPHPKAHVLGRKPQDMALSAAKTGRQAVREAHDVGGRPRRRLGVADFDPTEKLAAVREGLLNVQSTVADSVGDTGEGTSHAVQQATALVANADAPAGAPSREQGAGGREDCLRSPFQAGRASVGQLIIGSSARRFETARTRLERTVGRHAARNTRGHRKAEEPISACLDQCV